MLVTRAELGHLLLWKQGLLGERILAGAGGATVWVRRHGFLALELRAHALAPGHDIALLNRVADYRPGDLDAALYDGDQLFEHCLHVPGALPAADYGLIYDPERGSAVSAPGSIGALLLARLEAEGAATLRELQAHLRNHGRGERRATVRAAHDLYASGTILVRRREGTQGVYDLGSRVLPRHQPEALPLEERMRAIARRALAVLAPVTRASLSQALNAIGSRAKLGLLEIKRAKGRLVADMLAEGDAVRVDMEDSPAWYLVPKGWLTAPPARPEGPGPRAAFLSPLDPVVWDRLRAHDLFGYDWRQTAYLQVVEGRRFSAPSLPVLYGQALVGRLEPQMSWASNRLIVHGLYLQDEAMANDASFRVAFITALHEFAAFHEARDIEVAGPLPFRLRP